MSTIKIHIECRTPITTEIVNTVRDPYGLLHTGKDGLEALFTINTSFYKEEMNKESFKALADRFLTFIKLENPNTPIMEDYQVTL